MSQQIELKDHYKMEELLEIMAFLRSDQGCPWDRVQTHESIRKNVLEEAYEVVEAIEDQNIAGLREELGDLLMQVVFHAQMGHEAGTFDFDEVVSGICRKLITRHSHLFGEDQADTPEAVLLNWEKNKQKEKAGRAVKSLLDDVPKTLPALAKSCKIQQKASRVGFDWPDSSGALAKVHEELSEIEASLDHGEDKIEEEVGDLLFAVVNYARLLHVDPEVALGRSARKFIRRFQHIEQAVARDGSQMIDQNPEQLDALWNDAKLRGL
jgi:tetrapyrrole methylase family protein/MazG family protein